jgi:DNA-binding beta-propeller fold protein YncE
MKTKSIGPVLLAAALLTLATGAAPAAANRALLSEALLQTSITPTPLPPPEGEIEGACGLAVGPDGSLYVSDYYHRVIDRFSSFGEYESQIALPGANAAFGSVTLDAVCGLALDSGGRLYANEWHQGALRLLPSEVAIDGGESTGVAVDAAGNLYVDDRTEIAEYTAPVAAGDPPVTVIDLGPDARGYGLAVSSDGTRVYVADAADDTVKAYEPAVSTSVPVQTIAGFNSLRDAALAVDPTNGHLLVVDNLQPGFEHPEAAVMEYDDTGAFLGRLPGAPIHGQPSGIAVDPTSGALYVTSGNDEGANVLAYGPYDASVAPALFPASQAAAPYSPAPTAAATVSTSSPRLVNPSHRGSTASASEVFQRAGVRIKVDGKLAPVTLPRRGTAGVHVSLETKIASTDGGTPPQLHRITIAINRNGHFEPRGLPVCRLVEIQPSSTRGALAACRGSLVGQGSFSADVKLPEQSPFPSAGKVLAFNGVVDGRSVILAHVFGTEPVPTSFTLPFAIGSAGGTYGTVLRATVPKATGGFITGLRLNLGRSFHAGGQRRNYISAGCPAPPGFPGAVFPLARTTFAFAGGPKPTSVLVRNCRVR